MRLKELFNMSIKRKPWKTLANDPWVRRNEMTAEREYHKEQDEIVRRNWVRRCASSPPEKR